MLVFSDVAKCTLMPLGPGGSSGPARLSQPSGVHRAWQLLGQSKEVKEGRECIGAGDPQPGLALGRASGPLVPARAQCPVDRWRLSEATSSQGSPPEHHCLAELTTFSICSLRCGHLCPLSA